MNCIKSENKKISYTEVGKFLFRRANVYMFPNELLDFSNIDKNCYVEVNWIFLIIIFVGWWYKWNAF